uniref:PAP-associated domain-containing protein n=1 Tax=Strongyloides venezuelensis TaxID=75913 RepID=A0A0K0F377_STRVS
MVEQLTVNTIIEPFINNPGVGNFTSPEMVIRKTFLMDSTTLLKDVCNVVMERIGLPHLSHTTTAFIETPKSINNNTSMIINKLPADLGGIKNFTGQPINIKIIVHGSLDDFVVFSRQTEASGNGLLHEEVSNDNDNILYSLTKEIIDWIREVSNEGITFDYLYVIRGIIEEKLNIIFCSRGGCLSSILSIVNEYFLHDSSNINGYLNDPSNVYKKTISKFDPQNEEPILEVWYQHNKFPKKYQLIQYSNYLNIHSGRFLFNRVTSKDVKKWFVKRTSYEMGENNASN